MPTYLQCDTTCTTDCGACKGRGVVRQFTGDYAFLSNFYTEPNGLSVEHRFQATKSLDPRVRDEVLLARTPGAAKRLGSKRGIVTPRPDWEDIKLSVMRDLVAAKFREPELREKLLATGDAYLQEGNRWNDTYWGVSLQTGKGRNELGKILMAVREEARRG